MAGSSPAPAPSGTAGDGGPRGPATVGSYTVLRVLGAGSAGRVALARTDRGARVALKVFRPELAARPEFRERLQAEVEAAARVDHPRVVTPVDADTESEQVWVASGYVAAAPLPAVLAERGPLAAPDARLLGVGLADAVAGLHAAGVVHGDLTPGEVLIGADGPHVTDAGLARATAATPLTRGGALVGTLGYLAPEQLTGHPADHPAGPAADVFALGAVLLFAAAWRRPFGDGDAIAVLHRVLHDDPDLAGLPDDLAAVVAACLRRDPDRRPDAEQVRDALLGTVPIGSVPIRTGPFGGAVPAPRPPADPPTDPRGGPTATPSGTPAGAGGATAGGAPGGAAEPWPTVVRRRLPAPYRGPSPARRVAAAFGVSASLVGLFAVTTADGVGVPPPRPVLEPITAAVAETLGR